MSMIGKTLAHYEITSQLGKGGMGEVFRAKDQKRGCGVGGLILLLLCISTGACIPIPSRQVKGVSGPAKSVDYGFIKEGLTTRDEVVKKLGWMDARLNEDRLFWGRWFNTKWLWGDGSVLQGSDYNLWIEFNEQGVVVRSRLIDDSEINSELLSWWKRSGRRPVDRASLRPMRVQYSEGGRPVDATLLFRKGSIELRAAASSTNPAVGIWIDEILSMGPASRGSDLVSLFQRFTYREGLNEPRSIGLSIQPADLFTLLKYAASSDEYIPDPSIPAPVLIAPPDGMVFDTYPRSTTLRWNRSWGVTQYIVQWDYSSNGVWAGDRRDFPDYHLIIPTTIYTFEFIGAQPGRWRVWPVNANGQRGTPSEWRLFRYTR